MMGSFRFSLRAFLVATSIGCCTWLPSQSLAQSPKPRATVAGGNASWAPVFSPDGKMLVECSMSAAGDFTEFWDVKAAQRLRRIEHPNPHAAGSSTFHRVAFSADSKRVAIDLYRAIEIWDVATMTRVATIDSQHLHSGILLLSPDGSALAGMQHGGTGTHGHRTNTQVCCWDVLTGNVIMSYKPVPDQFTQMAFRQGEKITFTNCSW